MILNFPPESEMEDFFDTIFFTFNLLKPLAIKSLPKKINLANNLVIYWH